MRTGGGEGWGLRLRTVTEYLLKAAEFDELAQSAPEPAFKKRYADLAACYRMLAKEREQLVAAGTLPDTSRRD